MKNRLKNKFIKIALPLILILFSLWAGKGLFKYSVYSTHDGLHHISRSYDVIETIREGQFPPRWAGSLNYGCGIPIYNFFYPLYYYLVALIDPILKNVILTLKIISLLSLIIGTLFFYLWINQETKNKLSAFGGAMLYLFAPYRFSLILVRGSPEFLAYAILPIVLLFYALAFNNIKTKKFLIYLFFASLSGGFLTISHNFTVMFLMPIILCYLILKVVLLNNVGFKNILLIAFSYISIIGLGSYFIFPALIEQKFTQIGLNAFIQYKDHFPTLWQLIRSKWGYFYSAGGTENDGMSFMLGYAQWFVIAIFIVWLSAFIKRLFKNRSFNKKSSWILFLGLGSILVVFMMLDKSIFIWDRFPILTQIQFPWRLLGIAVFLISSLFSFLLINIKKKKLFLLILIFISALGVVGNRNHLLPEPVSEEDIWMFKDYEKLHFHRYSTTTMGDDIVAREAKGRCWFTDPEVSLLGEKVDYQVVEKKNTYGTIKFNNPTDNKTNSDFVFRLGYFPGAYALSLNGVTIEPKNCEGKICISSIQTRIGYNIISWKIIQTPIQKIFNTVTIVTLGIWILFLVIYYSGVGKDRKKLLRFILFLSVILIYSFFRFYNLSKKFGFDWDAERDANVVKDILIGKFTLIGPRVLGPSGFFLPPYFYYILAPFYVVSKLNPNAILFFLYFYNILYLVVATWVLSRLYSRKLVLIFITILALMPYAVMMDTTPWNPIMIPIVFLGFIYLLHKFDGSKKGMWLFLSSICFSLGVSFHVQFAFYGILFLPILVNNKTKIRNIITVTVGAILSFLPLLFFDLRHDFINAKLIIGMVGGLGRRDVYQIIFVWSNFLSKIFEINITYLGGIIFYFVFVLFLGIYIYFTKKRNSYLWIGMFFVWLFFPLVFYIYGNRPSEYYFNFLIPIIVISTSSLIADIIDNKKRLIKILCAVLMMIVFYNYFLEIINYTKYISPKSYYHKEKVISLLKSLTSNSPPFNLSYAVTMGEDVGFRYMIDYNKISYSGKNSDTLIQLTYPSNPKNDTFTMGVYGLLVPDTWLNNSLQLK